MYFSEIWVTLLGVFDIGFGWMNPSARIAACSQGRSRKRSCQVGHILLCHITVTCRRRRFKLAKNLNRHALLQVSRWSVVMHASWTHLLCIPCNDSFMSLHLFSQGNIAIFSNVMFTLYNGKSIFFSKVRKWFAPLCCHASNIHASHSYTQTQQTHTVGYWVS